MNGRRSPGEIVAIAQRLFPPDNRRQQLLRCLQVDGKRSMRMEWYIGGMLAHPRTVCRKIRMF